MKTKILYIYGYGSSANGETYQNLVKLLDSNKYEIISISYPQLTPDIAIPWLKDKVKELNINIVIGSSLGAFYALHIDNIPRIVLNPCMVPSVELPKIGVESEVANRFAQFETYERDNEQNECIYALFSKDDELIDYSSMYRKYFTYMDFIDGHHHLTYDELKESISKIEDKMQYFVSDECFNKLDETLCRIY